MVSTERPVRNFGRSRFWWEQIQALLTPTDWPAALAERCGGSCELVLREMRVQAAGPLGSASKLRIGFASDFHAGPLTSGRVLDRAAAALASAAPDVLLLGGDFVSIRHRYVSRVTERLGAIPAPAGRFAVLGNHDHWAGAVAITRELERAGIELLTNANRRLPPPYDQVTVCGLDDHMTGYPDAAQAFAGATAIRVVLMHAPSGLVDVGEYPFTLALAGHTHGGQIALPNGYPPYVPHGPLSRQYCAGRFELPRGQVLLVSRGVGCSTLPIRWNSPAEVHLCTLYGSNAGDQARTFDVPDPVV
ncbi:MAG TPA: metallophosphoesterase [Gemmatimonadales bacterium]|nr:metallophosphoesterase [Gemmatimonadales bacterium]